jgi:hypothetical protein
VSRTVTHVAGWTSETLLQWSAFPSQTVYRSTDTYQICTIHFVNCCTFFSQGWQPCIGTGGSWFLVRIPHKIKSWTTEVTVHLFLQNHHTHVETMKSQHRKQETFKLQTKAAHERSPCHTTVPLYHTEAAQPMVSSLSTQTDQPSNRMKLHFLSKKQKTNKLHGLSPRANYTDRATAASRRSGCQLLRIKGCHVVSVTDPYGRILGFLDRSRYFSIK